MIRATVVDLQKLVKRPDPEVSVLNGPRNFSYNASSGALFLPGGRMEETHGRDAWKKAVTRCG